MKQHDPPPLPAWNEDDFSDSIVEVQLKASIADARTGHLPRDLPAASPQPRPELVNAIRPEQSTSPDAQLIAQCGCDAIDGYLEMREYAAAKGLDLVEFHHKGIDLQDLISTLIIQQQKRAELAAGGRKWKS